MLSWPRVKLLSLGSFPECSQCSAPGLSEVLSELSTFEGIVRAQQHSRAQTRQLQGESPEELRRPGKRTQHSRKQGQSCQNPPGSGGLEGYRSLSCWIEALDQCGTQIPTVAGGRVQVVQRPSAGCAHPQGARPSSQLLPASAPPRVRAGAQVRPRAPTCA